MIQATGERLGTLCSGYIKWHNKTAFELREKNAIQNGALMGGALALPSGALLNVWQINAFLSGGASKLLIPSIGLIPNLGLISLAALITFVAVVVIKYTTERSHIDQMVQHKVQKIGNIVGWTVLVMLSLFLVKIYLYPEIVKMFKK